MQIAAKDSDFGDYGALTFDIMSDMAKEMFAVDGDTGQITTKVRLDRETKSVRISFNGRYDLTIMLLKFVRLKSPQSDWSGTN